MADPGLQTYLFQMNAGERLRIAKEEVLRKWAGRARERLPVAWGQDVLTLVNDLPEFLDELAGILSAGAPRQALAAREAAIATDHGRERAQWTSWSLRQVVGEYEVLLEVLFETLEAQAPLSPDERDILHHAFHAAVRNAVHEFDRLRSAEKSARHEDSEQRFGRFVEAVTDYAIFTVDPLGTIDSWNVGAQRLKRYTPEEAIGHHFEMLYPEEGRRRDEPMAHLRAAAAEGRFRGEGVRLRKNGELFLADVSITPIYSDGKLRGFVKVVQDLTERNLLMQERDLSRTEADRLRVAARYRERFVQTLSHDLRTPLSAVKAAAALILRSPQDEARVRTWAQRISDAVDRSDAMISDLLDAARVDASEAIPLRIEPCDLRRVVEDACDELRTRYGDRFAIAVDGQTSGHWDPAAMRRAFDNLLSNALKYGTPGTLVAVSMKHVQGRLLIAVHNRGTVIPVEEQARLFEPFHRAHDAQRTGERGWGLGLTVVRGIVEAHQGIIKVESYLGAGTTFTIDVPQDARKAPADEPS